MKTVLKLLALFIIALALSNALSASDASHGARDCDSCEMVVSSN